MPPREPVRTTESPLRCDHCGRLVSETRHTRTSYAVDYYSVHSGHGEVCSFSADDGQRGGRYVKLFDRFDVITCVQCYGRPAVQEERDRHFQPEREGATGQQGHT
jgi:hypothetical protein